jgi:hypothetical protein
MGGVSGKWRGTPTLPHEEDRRLQKADKDTQARRLSLQSMDARERKKTTDR